MKLSVYIHGSSPFNPKLSFDEYIKQAQYYEEIGIDTIWFADHLIRTPDVNEQPIYETWTLIAALAAVTKKIRFGTMVTPITYRNFGVFAKILSTVDHISNGRLTVGLGTGWYEKEHRMFGIPFFDRKTRYSILEETIQHLLRFWNTDDHITSESDSKIQLLQAYLNPKPIQKPHPPILIGGGGEMKTLKLVAKYAQMSNFGGSSEIFKHKLSILEAHCDKYDRKISKIVTTSNMAIVIGKNDQEVKDAVNNYRQRFIDLGITAPSLADFSKNRLVGTPEQIVGQLNQLKEIGVNMINLTINDKSSEKLLPVVIDQYY